MGQIHGDKAHIATTLAEFGAMLVTVQGKFETKRIEFADCSAKPIDIFRRGFLGIRNHKYIERSPDKIHKIFKNRSHLLVIPDTEIMKAEEKFASHIDEDSKRL